MQNCLNNQNHVSKDLFNGINMNQKKTVEQRNWYLHFLINPSFQGVNSH